MHITSITPFPFLQLTQEDKVAPMGEMEDCAGELDFGGVERVFLVEFYLVKGLGCWPECLEDLSLMSITYRMIIRE